MLRWLKKQIYQNGFMGVMGDVMREIQALQPKDTATIKWSMGVDGMEANVVSSKETGNRLQDDGIEQTSGATFTIAQVATGPNGYGALTVKAIVTVNPDGTWSTSDVEIPKIGLRLP